MTGTKTRTKIHVIIILAGCLLTILPNIGTRDLWEPEELRYTEIAREMANTGEWALLHLNGIPYPDKPPLFFWMICVSAKCFGGFHAVAARLPNIASGIALVLLVYFFGRRLVGERAAFLGSLVLMATPFFVWTCAEARMDTPLSLFITLALMCFWRDYNSGGRRIPLKIAFGVFTGLAILTKGPIGFLLPFLTGLVFAAREKQLRRVLNLPLLLSIAVALALVAPWLVAACVRGGEDFSGNLLFTQNVRIAVQGLRHSKPFYHFFKVVPGILAPWTLFIPAMLYYPFAEEDPERRRGRMFVLCWFATIFLFFTLSKGKRTIYMAPLMPAAGLLLGAVFDQFISAELSDAPRRGVRWVLGATIVLLLAFCVIAPILLQFLPVLVRHLPALRGHMGPAFEKFPQYVSLSLAIVGAAALGCVVSSVLFFTRRRAASLFTLLGTISVAWFLASVLILPAVNNEKSARVMLNHVAQVIDKDKEPLSIYGTKRVGYALYWGRDIPIIEDQAGLQEFLSSPNRAFCLARQDQFPDSLLLAGDMGYVVWRDACGYREHILLSNRPRGVAVEPLRLFRNAHPGARMLETGKFTVLVSGAVPYPSEKADVDLVCTGGDVRLRFFPLEGDHTVSTTFRIRGLCADDAELIPASVGGTPSPLKWEVAPHSSPLVVVFSFRTSGGAMVRVKEETRQEHTKSKPSLGEGQTF